MTFLQVQEISVRFGGISALTELSFDIDKGQICGLIGPNGAGKTTLFNVVSRIYDPTQGQLRLDGEDLLQHAPHEISRLGIFRTFQNLALWPRMTVIENVMAGAHTAAKQNMFTSMFDIGRKREERELELKAYEILADLGLGQVAYVACAGLPYGTLKRVELARALMGEPKLLMLDEPATGLTHSEVDSLAELIRDLRDRYNLTVLLVEHHMGMVMKLSEHIVVLDFGRKIAEGPPAIVQEDPAVIEAYLGAPA